MATASQDITPREMAPVIAASTTGTAIEWYDFFLYGTLSATVFPLVFFRDSSPVAGSCIENEPPSLLHERRGLTPARVAARLLARRRLLRLGARGCDGRRLL